MHGQPHIKFIITGILSSFNIILFKATFLFLSLCNVRSQNVSFLIQSDQKASVHLMITIQIAGAQRLFDHHVYLLLYLFRATVQFCNSPQMARTCGRNMWELCAININLVQL